ncbi:MAG: hypothetical protein ACPGSC_00350 [Granulosicoccaceae bacterium]
MDWLEKLYSKQWTHRFLSRATKHYGHLEDLQTLAEDAASMTAMKLSGYTEEEATDALILSVFKNALTDCVRERHGFPRPRKWLEDLGNIGRRLFRLICLESKTRQQVADWVQTETDSSGQIPGDAPTVADAQALAQSIFDQMQQAQECAPWRRKMERDTGEEEGAASPFLHLSEPRGTPEDEAAFDQIRHFVEAVSGAADAGGTSERDRRRMHQLADRTWESLGLDAQDRLVMNAYLGRGLAHSGSAASELTEQEMALDLGLSVPKIRNRRKKVLEAMRELFS